MNKTQILIEKKTQSLLKEFKRHFDLDFRKHQFIQNDYGNTPTFNYNFAEEIVRELNAFLIEKFGEKRVIYNTQMDIESLRTTRLKIYLENRIYSYVVYDYNN